MEAQRWRPDWSLPGYRVQVLLGSGRTGQVWRARELTTGDDVVLKRLPPGADPAGLDTLTAVLGSLDTPYVVRLRAVLPDGDGRVLVLDHAGGGSLAGLLARRGTLVAGEVVTVAGPLAQALAAAHARGLVHGGVTPASVLFTAEGKPLLAGLELAALAGQPQGRVADRAGYLDPALAAGDRATPASDVWALGALCHAMLTGAAPGERIALSASGPLVEAVELALSAEPAARPDAATLAGLVRRAHPAAPVRLFDGRAPGRSTRAPRHAVSPRGAHSGWLPRRPARLAAVAVGRRMPGGGPVLAAGVALLVLVGGAVWQLSRADEGHSAARSPRAVHARAPDGASGTTVGQGPDWRAVLDRLDAARADAFAAGDVMRLAAVYTPESPTLAADTALLADLVAAGHTAHGVRHRIRTVVASDVGPRQARLRVVDVLAGYEVRAADGAVVTRTPGRAPASHDVLLELTDAGWRLAEVRRS